MAPSAQQPEGKPLTEFHLFLKLPIDLRAEVFKWMFPRGENGSGRPRLCLYISKAPYPNDELPKPPNSGFAFFPLADRTREELDPARAPVKELPMYGNFPAVLQVNQESRRVTKLSYRLMFVTPRTSTDMPVVGITTYYNPDLDIVYIEDSQIKVRPNDRQLREMDTTWTYLHMMKEYFPGDFDAIQGLETDGYITDAHSILPTSLNEFFAPGFKKCFLELFRNLKLLNIVDDYGLDLVLPRECFGKGVTTRYLLNHRWLDEPNRPDTDELRDYYKAIKSTDPAFSMPSIRFAPDDGSIEAILSRWRALGKIRTNGGDPFTDISVDVEPISSQVDVSEIENLLQALRLE